MVPIHLFTCVQGLDLWSISRLGSWECAVGITMSLAHFLSPGDFRTRVVVSCCSACVWEPMMECLQCTQQEDWGQEGAL